MLIKKNIDQSQLPSQSQSQKTILVIGGAGYIGSHMVLMLAEKNYNIIVLDNLSTGYRDSVLAGEFIQGDLGDKKLLAQIFEQHSIDAVMHFAAFIQVGESVTSPLKYYENNLAKTVSLLAVMQEYGIKHFIFSSTAAVYGNPNQDIKFLTEEHPKNPINPYGHSKYMVERVLQDCESAWGLTSVSLRYFNAAGADPESRVGERHEPETHLIPLVLQAANKQREHITVYGDDYDTPDGSCLRDYVHINDLCSAHLKALEYLFAGNSTDFFNLGSGETYSVKQIITVAEKITKQTISVHIGEKRPGDPAILAADASKAKAVLNWQAQYSDIENIIQDAWNFYLKTNKN